MRTKKSPKLSKGNELVTRSFLDTRLSPVHKHLDRVEIRLTNLEIDFGEMRADMTEMKQTINSGFARMDAFLKHLDDLKIESAARLVRNSRVDNRLANHDRRLGKIEHKIFAK